MTPNVRLASYEPSTWDYEECGETRRGGQDKDICASSVNGSNSPPTGRLSTESILALGAGNTQTHSRQRGFPCALGEKRTGVIDAGRKNSLPWALRADSASVERRLIVGRLLGRDRGGALTQRRTLRVQRWATILNAVGVFRGTESPNSRGLAFEPTHEVGRVLVGRLHRAPLRTTAAIAGCTRSRSRDRALGGWGR